MRTLKKQMGSLKQFFTSSVIADEDGVGVVEIILILVVLISLVIIFKDKLTKLVKSILDKATSQADSV